MQSRTASPKDRARRAACVATGNVPGVVYGGGEDPVAFQVTRALLRHALAHAGAVLELSIGGDAATPVVVKEITRHPVTGDTIHIDMLRVRLDVRRSSATVVLDLVGAEDSPGVKEGGVLEQVTRELTIEALPTDIPDSIHHDVSALQIGDTLTLEAVTPPSGSHAARRSRDGHRDARAAAPPARGGARDRGGDRARRRGRGRRGGRGGSGDEAGGESEGGDEGE